MARPDAWLREPNRLLPVVSAHVGEPQAPEQVERLGCGFRSILPDQVGARCPETAKLHLLILEHGTDIRRPFLACFDHQHVAAEIGDLIAIHPAQSWCGLPATWFDADINACVLDSIGVEA